MSKEVILPATANLIVVPSLNRRQILGGLGALALPIVGCSSDEDGPVGSAGSAGSPAGGANPGGAPSAGTGVGGSATVAGSSAGGAPGGAGATSATAGSPNGGMAGSGVTGGTSPGGGPGAGGAGAAGASGGGASGATGGASTAGSGGSGGALVVPDFGPAPKCTLTPTDKAGEGPFFIHEMEQMDDPSLMRADIREGKPGVEFHLHIRVLDESKGCNMPIAGVEVHIWNTDALGFYSGFANQNPNMQYSGPAEPPVANAERFCRGAQSTNAEGIVSFRCIYPGWYFGRPIHTHFVALKPGSGPATTSYRGSQYHLFTTQFYYDEAFSREIHANAAPYNTRLTGGYDQYVKPDMTNTTRPSLKLEGSIAVGTLNIVTSSTTSRR